MKESIFAFNTTNVTTRKLVGGKAQSLIELTKTNLPVPEGIVLSVEFFEDWILQLKATKDWKEFVAEPSKKNSDKIKSLASERLFSKEQHDVLIKSMKRLHNNEFYSVRSSSPDEDLEGTSFAGMYDSYLNITKDNIEATIIKTFASLFDYRVVHYKIENNYNLNHSSIAIIIQKQIKSDVSGIGFSLNPNNNAYDEAVVEASFGLGEAIVSGQVTPDTHIVNKLNFELIEEKIHNKVIAFVVNSLGGIDQVFVDEPRVRALSKHQLKDVVELISRVEAYYQFPVDTEWAIEGKSLYLLQARPITTYLPLFPEMVTLPNEPKILYMDHNMVSQGFTEPLSVAGGDIWGELVDVMEMHIFPRDEGGLMINLHGRQYVNISNTIRGMGLTYTKTILKEYNETIIRMVEKINLKKEYKAKKKTPAMNKARKGVLHLGFYAVPFLLKSQINLTKLRNDCEDTANQIIKNYSQLDESLPFNQLVTKCVDIIYPSMIHQGSMIAAMYAMSQLKKLFKGLDIENELMALGMALSNNPSAQMGQQMFQMAAAEDFQFVSTYEIFKDKVDTNSFSEEFMTIYNQYMSTFGHRGFREIDVASERTYETIESFYNQLKHINIEENQTLVQKEKQQKAYDHLHNLAKEGGFVKRFTKYSAIYQNLFGYREMPKYLLAIMMSKLRQIALRIADGFVEQGRLNSREQIFNLHTDQITAAQSDKKLDLIDLCTQNTKPYKKVAHIKNWPTLIDSRGKIFRDIRISEEGDYIGDSVSPGIVRGHVKVLHTPYEKTVNPGEIIVTKATEPSWTPVFINASGVILEIGGTLQHGAIIAREYGLPCVSGINNVYETFKDGDFVEIDGNSGIIRIINE